MTGTVELVVLGYTRFGENRLVVHTLSREYGRRSFLTRVGKGGGMSLYLPLNILEAMLCGKPVVASDNRGHRELVHDGINGYLVEADDIDAYVQYICQILEEGKDYSEQTVRSAQMYTDVHVMKELAAIYFEGQQA